MQVEKKYGRENSLAKSVTIAEKIHTGRLAYFKIYVSSFSTANIWIFILEGEVANYPLIEKFGFEHCPQAQISWVAPILLG